MNMENLPHLTICGLPGIDSVPFGTHACHFYKNKDALIAALVPYFVAGLRANERCLWITASPLPRDEAINALRTALPDVDNAIQAERLRIHDFDEWYQRAGQLKGEDVVRLWLDEEERALAAGYNGLRITGNVAFLTPDTWSSFMEYEHAVSTQFRNRRIVALCSYLVAQCEAKQMDEIMRAHNCVLEHEDDIWRVVPRVGYPVRNNYRCYFTDEADRICRCEIIEGLDDAEAALKAQELVASSRFSAAEVWLGRRLVGHWINKELKSTA